MAQTKKTQTKSTVKKNGAVEKIHKIMATDMFKSVAIASLLANAFFIIMILVGGSHSIIYVDKGDYKQRAVRLEDAQNSFCKKAITDRYIEEAKKNNKEEDAKVVVAANCGTGEYGERFRDLKQNLTNQQSP